MGLESIIKGVEVNDVVETELTDSSVGIRCAWRRRGVVADNDLVIRCRKSVGSNYAEPISLNVQGSCIDHATTIVCLEIYDEFGSC